MRRNYAIFLTLGLLSLFCPPEIVLAQEGGQGTGLVLMHTPFATFKHGQSVKIAARTNIEVEGMRFYIRYGNSKQFQVRTMEKEKDNSYSIIFDTSELSGLQLEYYFSALAYGKEIFYPAEAPEKIIAVTGTSDKPLPEIPPEILHPKQKEKVFKLPFKASGTVERKVRENNLIVEQNATTTGNLHLFQNYQSGTFGVNFDSNFPFIYAYPQGMRKFDLSNMMIAVTKGRHAVRAGDINVFESEFTIGAMGRRGMEYVFDNQKAYFHVFDVNSQQPRRFEGFGIPSSNASLLGGAVGYKFFKNAASLKAVYLKGKDTPSQGGNIGYSYFVRGREGNVMALIEELNLFQNRLNLKGEYARSSHGELETAGEKSQGNAWNFRGNYSLGFLTVGGGYRHIGKDFNPIGYQFFTSDRQGYDALATVTYGRFSLSGVYSFGKDNVENNPEEYTTKNREGSVIMSVGLGNILTFNMGYRTGKQKTFQQESQTTLQDSRTQDLSSNLNFMLGPVSLNFSATNSNLTSPYNPQSDRENLTFNLGAGVRGEGIYFNPSMSFTRMTNKFTNEKTWSYNSYVSTEISVVPKLLSIAFLGSFARSEYIPRIWNEALNLSTYANVSLAELFKVVKVAFTVSGNFRANRTTKEKINSFYDIWFKFDFAF